MQSSKEESSYQLLDFAEFGQLLNWSVAHNTQQGFSFNKRFEAVRIGDVIKRNRKKVSIQDNIEYQRVTIKLYGKGVTERDRAWGKNIGTKNQYEISPNQFIISKIDARNGAFGIVPESLAGAVTTQDFLSYDIAQDKIKIEFLNYLTHTEAFLQICQTASSGTTGRKRIDEKFFLSLEIPLPSLEEQASLVANYQSKNQRANQLEQEAKALDLEIEDYLLEELGVKFRKVKKRASGKLYFTTFDKISTWVQKIDETIFYEDLSKTNYSITNLGASFTFVNRSWDKKSSKEYIELGAVDPDFGILKTKTISHNKAPSRATQIVWIGDLIIGTTRPYLKKFAIVGDKHNGNVASSGFAVIQEDTEKYNLIFLNEVLKSPIGVKQFEMKMTGALYPAITQSDLQEIQIPLPDIEKQNEIALTIQQMKMTQKQKLQEAESLKKAAIEEFEATIFNI